MSEGNSLDELCVNTIRTLSMDAVQKANSGHPGTPMALAPVAHVLYTRIMRHSPKHPQWPNRDRFILSCGHASMLLYSMLHLTGYEVSLDDIKNFRQLHSPTAGHPEYNYAPGIDTTTGPLGQGIATAVGMAIGERMLNARLGDEIVDHSVFVLCSDGDIQEGVQAEAAALAGHLGLGKLVAFYDDNHITIEGDTELSMSEDVGKRYEAYGWHVQNLGEELDLDSLERATRDAMAVADRPSLIIVRTHIAPGAPNLQDTHKAHGSPLGEEEIRLTKEAYDWPSQEPFFIPDEALERFRECVPRGEELHRDWEGRLEGADPERRDLLLRLVDKKLPDGWDADVPTFDPEETGKVATRKAGETALNWAAKKVPELVGGSADLAGSTLTLIKDAGSVQRGRYDGRNLHFGIREHGMGAAVNGLTMAGLRAYGATFLIFSDYMKAAVRLSALMHVPSIFVYTHDSIGLGEDGPTHQPIEQLAGLRAVPNLNVIRPADSNETVRGWQYALSQDRTPSLFALSRQGVPTLDPTKVPADCVERGAYVLEEAEGGDPEVILMATGTEVHIAAEARDLLQADGISTRLVSMPCMDRFACQDQAYRDEVLPPDVRARVAVEAASPFGWHRWVGEQGDVVAMESFGASGPYQELYEYFGFTPEKIAERARATRGAERSNA